MELGEQARNTLTAYVPQIEKRLVKFFKEELAKKFGFNNHQRQLVYEMLVHTSEHNLRPAKRLRGSFVNYGYLLSGKKIDAKVWRAAVGVEIIHTALLMHDDFMDRDAVRRGGLTTHKFFEKKFFGDAHLGAALAVTLGDAILVLGIKEVSDCGNIRATAQLLRGLVNTGYGQAYDVSLEALKKWTEADVIALHMAKTAIYTYENPLAVGAYLGGINDKNIFAILHDYAMAGGVAFQLQDDILGVFGTSEKTGKSADSDLLQGKCTLLVWQVMMRGTLDQKKKLTAVWGKLVATKTDLAKAKEAIVQSGSYAYSKALAKKYATKAAKTASELRKFPGLNSRAIDYIQGIAEYMVNRDV